MPSAGDQEQAKVEEGGNGEEGEQQEQQQLREEERSVTPAPEPAASEVAEEDEGLDVEPASQQD